MLHANNVYLATNFITQANIFFLVAFINFQLKMIIMTICKLYSRIYDIVNQR